MELLEGLVHHCDEQRHENNRRQDEVCGENGSQQRAVAAGKLVFVFEVCRHFDEVPETEREAEEPKQRALGVVDFLLALQRLTESVDREAEAQEYEDEQIRESRHVLGDHSLQYARKVVPVFDALHEADRVHPADDENEGDRLKIAGVVRWRKSYEHQVPGDDKCAERERRYMRQIIEARHQKFGREIKNVITKSRPTVRCLIALWRRRVVGCCRV